VLARPTGPGLASTVSSTNVFHSPHMSQRPAHLGCTAPQDWQTKRATGLATSAPTVGEQQGGEEDGGFWEGFHSFKILESGPTEPDMLRSILKFDHNRGIVIRRMTALLKEYECARDPDKLWGRRQ